MRPITDRQRAALEAIRSFTARHGYPPTLRDIMRAMGIKSTNGVRDHLRALERRGAIRVSPGLARGIAITEEHRHVAPTSQARPSASPASSVDGGGRGIPGGHRVTEDGTSTERAEESAA